MASSLAVLLPLKYISEVAPIKRPPPPPLPTFGENMDWNDYVFRFDEENDVMRLFFIKTSIEAINSYVDLVKGVRAAKNADGKVLFLEFSNAKEKLACHLFDTQEDVDHRPPLDLTHLYDNTTDLHVIWFVPQAFQNSLQSMESEPDARLQFIFDMDSATRRILGVQCVGASRILEKKSILVA